MSCCFRLTGKKSADDEDEGRSRAAAAGAKTTASATTNSKPDGKTVLFVPLDCVGHVNSLISIADNLKGAGHRTVFLFYDPMDGGLKRSGHEVYDCSCEGLVESQPSASSEAKWNHIVAEMGKLWRSSLMDNFEQTTRVGLGGMMRDIMKHEARVQRKLALIKPDFIVIDHYFIQPALVKYGKPWARVYSASPLALHPKRARLPPATLGLPTDWLDSELEAHRAQRDEWQEMAARADAIKMELHAEWNAYLATEHKLPATPTDPVSYVYDSPYLNVYMYPEELDYSHLATPDRWQRCDSILRINSTPGGPTKPVDKFEVPAELARLPGKLIFLSMGSLASGDVALMKRLVEILAECPHKFIVSRGPNWQDYELAANMWGEKFVPQLGVLPQVDLIITHGGNNTITECFYFGVPGFVVCPVFSDQYDNAQRIEEVGLGRRVDPFHCEPHELLGAIEQVLADAATIKPRMAAISERMQRPENKYRAIKLFEQFVAGDHS